MALLAIVCSALIAVLLSVSIALLGNMLKISRATREFRRKSNNLPIVGGLSLISGHILSVVVNKNVCEVVTKLHKQHGKTYGWMYREKPAISTIDLDLIKRIVLDDPNKHINRPPIDLPMEYNEDSLMFAKDDKWRRMRREVASALTKQKFIVPNVVREIEGSIKKLTEAIDKRIEVAAAAREERKQPVAAKVDIDDLAHRYSLDLVYGSLYKQYNQIDFDAHKDYYVDVVDSGLRAMQNSPFIRLGVVFPFAKPVVDWLIMNFHPQGKWRSETLKFIKMQTKKSFEARGELKRLREAAKGTHKKLDEECFELADGTKFRRNMMDSISDSYFEGRLSKTEYFNTGFFLFNAADKTSADSLGRTIYYLSLDRVSQEKCRAAILAEGTDAEYLSWVLNEAMRLYPPAPVGCSRITTSEFELTSNGCNYIIPSGTIVITPLYTIHRLPEYWGDDAAEFKPERWADAKSFHPCQFMPFGAGIRSCLGKEFALFEMKMVLAALLSRYKFEANKQPFEFDSPFLINLVHDKPTYIRISRI